MKSYNIKTLNSIKFCTEVLRACPQISFETANMINKNNLIVGAAISEYTKEAQLLQERIDSNKELKVEEVQELIRNLNTKEYSVELSELGSELFKEITGEKEWDTEGGKRRFSYREAFFEILGSVIKE